MGAETTREARIEREAVTEGWADGRRGTVTVVAPAAGRRGGLVPPLRLRAFGAAPLR
jgi:hypothetical protein